MSDEKKRLSAIGGLALGLVGANAIADADGVTGREIQGAQQLQGGLVFAYDYQPRVPFDVVDRLPQSTVNHIANLSDTISDPDDYNGHIVVYKPGQPRDLAESPGEYALVLVKEAALSPGTTYVFDGNAQIFDTKVNLLTDTIRSVGTATATETTTETTGNETTVDVNVTETTATNESG